ncbi:MAG: hypothetical protein AAF489_17185 [Bacteroidota bacterium]
MKTEFLDPIQIGTLVSGIKSGDDAYVELLCKELDRLRNRIMELEMNTALLVNAYSNNKYTKPKF